MPMSELVERRHIPTASGSPPPPTPEPAPTGASARARPGPAPAAATRPRTRPCPGPPARLGPSAVHGDVIPPVMRVSPPLTPVGHDSVRSIDSACSLHRVPAARSAVGGGRGVPGRIATPTTRPRRRDNGVGQAGHPRRPRRRRRQPPEHEGTQDGDSQRPRLSGAQPQRDETGVRDPHPRRSVYHCRRNPGAVRLPIGVAFGRQRAVAVRPDVTVNESPAGIGGIGEVDDLADAQPPSIGWYRYHDVARTDPRRHGAGHDYIRAQPQSQWDQRPEDRAQDHGHDHDRRKLRNAQTSDEKRAIHGLPALPVGCERSGTIKSGVLGLPVERRRGARTLGGVRGGRIQRHGEPVNLGRAVGPAGRGGTGGVRGGENVQ